MVNPKFILYILIIIVVIVLIVKFGKRLVARLGAQDYLNANDDLGAAEKKNGKKPTHSEVEFKNYAAKIKGAKGYWLTDDDEDAVRDVFNQMKNGLDVSELIKNFGVIDGYPLAAYLYSFLSGSEIETYVNAPLRGNGVAFQF